MTILHSPFITESHKQIRFKSSLSADKTDTMCKISSGNLGSNF